MLIDTHIHLYSDEFNEDRDNLLMLAADAGVNKFLLPNIDVTTIDDVFALCKKHNGICYPMMGLHPCYVKDDYENQLKKIHNSFIENKNAIIAIGEIGLDFYWDLTFRQQQEDAFRKQVLWAAEANLPIAIHSRDATDAVIDILKEMQIPGLKGVFHCFSGDKKQAEEIIYLGLMLGIGGVITFKNSGLDKVVEEVELKHLLLETDGPYLAPAPYRGKRNEPSYLKIIAEKIAEIKNLPVDEIARVTTINATNLFKLV